LITGANVKTDRRDAYFDKRAEDQVILLETLNNDLPHSRALFSHDEDAKRRNPDSSCRGCPFN